MRRRDMSIGRHGWTDMDGEVFWSLRYPMDNGITIDDYILFEPDHEQCYPFPYSRAKNETLILCERTSSADARQPPNLILLLPCHIYCKELVAYSVTGWSSNTYSSWGSTRSGSGRATCTWLRAKSSLAPKEWSATAFN